MFERLTLRARLRAAARARAQAAALAGRLRDELPPGLSAAEDEAGVAIEGKGARRRFALDPALKWLIGGGR